MIESLNLILAGVGGQGTLVAGKLLGTIAIDLGLDVRVSEVHGMAQRGGSVITYVRMGPVVYSPVVEPGTADVILAFEELEALRWAPLLRPGGLLLVNQNRIAPMSVSMGQAKYPEGIIASLEEAAGSRAVILHLDALNLARQAGNTRAVNIVMIGAMARYCQLPEDVCLRAVDAVFAEKLRAVNRAAFEAGSAIMEQEMSAR